MAMARALRAISEPRRLEILRLIGERELSSGEIASHFDITHPAVSQHLRLLTDAGLASVRREGTRRLYRVRPEGIAEVKAYLQEYWDTALQRLAAAAESEERRDWHVNEDGGDAISREVRIQARPETVFAFFTDPARMIQWMGTEAYSHPQPGGLYRVNVTGRNIARGEYLEVAAPRRVVFTWGWEDDGSEVPPGSSTVEVTLIPEGDATIVRLRHHGLSGGESRQGHLEGWVHYLNRLAMAAAGQDPGPDPWAVAAKPQQV